MSINDFVIENGVLISYKGTDEIVEIPAEVEKIGANAFEFNRKIKKVVFTCKNLKSIEAEAFYGCTSLEGIQIPEGTVQIASKAFLDCSNMEYIYIPSSVMIIGENITEDYVAVFGSTESEAEKYAKTRKAIFKTDFSTALNLINNKKVEIENIKTKTFEVLGEKITVSSSLKRYHEILEYYNIIRDDFFDELLDSIPKDYSFKEEIGDLPVIFESAKEKTTERLEKAGIYISEDAILSYAEQSMILMGTFYTFIFDTYIKLHNSKTADIKNQIQHFYEQAESQVTGLSYGYIGDSVGMLAYSIDDYFARRQQRKRAYAVAEKRKAAYVDEKTAELQRIYEEFYNQFVPLLEKTVDAHIASLLKCEIEYNIKHGLIDADITNAYNVEKSSGLMQELYDKGSSNAEYVLALAFKLYPMNFSAHVYAIEKELNCEDLEEMRDFLGLKAKLQPHRDRVRKDKYEKVTDKIISQPRAIDGVNLIKENADFLSKVEIVFILTKYSANLTDSLEKVIDENLSENSDVKDYFRQKLSIIVDKNAWSFFDEYGVAPIKSSVLPKDVQQSFDKLADYLETAYSKKQSEKGKQLDRAQELLSKAETIQDFEEVIASLSEISGYKNSKELLDKATEKKLALENKLSYEFKEEIRKSTSFEDLNVVEKKINSIFSSKDLKDALDAKKIEIYRQGKKKNLIRILSAVGVVLILLAICAIYSNTAHYRAFNEMIKTESFDYSVSSLSSKIKYNDDFNKWAKKKLAKKLNEYQKNDDVKAAIDLLYNSSIDETSNYLKLKATDTFFAWLMIGSIENGTYVSENTYLIKCASEYYVSWEDYYSYEETAFRFNITSAEDSPYKDEKTVTIDTSSGDVTVGINIDYMERLDNATEKKQQDAYAAEQAKIEAEKAAKEAAEAAKIAAENEKKNNYKKAVKLLKKGKKAEAAITFGKLGDYLDSREKSLEIWDEVAVRETLAAGGWNTVAIQEDGVVVAVGDNDYIEYSKSTVDGREDVVAVDAANGGTSVILESNGDVIVYDEDYAWTSFANFSDVVAVSSSGYFTACLWPSGTVGIAKNKKNSYKSHSVDDAESWTDIVAISAGSDHIIGLKLDGTVVAAGSDSSGQCDVSSWTDIVAISAGGSHTVGLKADGTVVATKPIETEFYFGQSDVGSWTDIVAISAGGSHTVGLKADGTVVATKFIETESYKYHGQCDVSSWTDIVAISAGSNHTVGLKSDGTVVATKFIEADDNTKYYDQCDVSDWSNIKLPNKAK